MRAALTGKPGERYILGGHDVTVTGLLREMSRLLDVPMPSHCLGAEEAVAFATAEEERCLREGGRPAIAREIVDMIVHGQPVDSTRAEKELSFQARPLEETILASLEWYRDNGYVQRS
ncbi:hypothetical protein ACFL6C_02315 [Myxococcota bacterium]